VHVESLASLHGQPERCLGLNLSAGNSKCHSQCGYSIDCKQVYKSFTSRLRYLGSLEKDAMSDEKKVYNDKGKWRLFAWRMSACVTCNTRRRGQ
jgi:hypothetical protein